MPRYAFYTVVGFIITTFLGAIAFPEAWYSIWGQDKVREEISVSLRAQADGVADQARNYVREIVEPVSKGGGSAWWAVQTGFFDTYKKVRFADRNSGWILGRRSLLSTADGGASWHGTRFGDIPQLNDFDTLDDGSIWVVGQEGILFFKSADNAWISKSFTTEHLFGVDFLDDGSVGWIVGDSGLLLRTLDNGVSWQSQDSGTDRNLITVHVFDTKVVWIGGSSISLLTIDGGETWVTLNSDQTFHGAQFFDQTLGIAVEANKIYKTNDRGVTWDQREITGRNISTAGFSFIKPDLGWIANRHGQIFYTEDGGESWITQFTGARQLNDVHFPDEYSGWAVGDNGILINTARLDLPVDNKSPSSLVEMLRGSKASPYFERVGAFERLERFVDDYEAIESALKRLADPETNLTEYKSLQP